VTSRKGTTVTDTATNRTLDPVTGRTVHPAANLAAEDTLAHLDGDDPVITGLLQCQGDVIFQPWPEDVAAEARQAEIDRAAPLLPAGFVLAAGAEGHSHTLIDPDQAGVLFAPWEGNNTIGTIVVPPDAVGYVEHEEHARIKLGPGVWAVRQQVEGVSAEQLDNVWD
jgi:hypothetical protein